ERSSSVTVRIMQEVADKYTPTKFKAKFSSVFGEMPQESADEEEEDVPIDSLTFTMTWDDVAKKALELVPSPFRQAAISGTEDYAQKNDHAAVSAATVEEYRKELGM
ncbi:MAG: hypothetical protein WCQ99_06320, partial [Pseudomonadota bacterium]